MNVRISYREAAIQGASPVRLVICLYEQAIEDLRRALAALEKKDIPARTSAINHAHTVIGQLQGTLDSERGGEVARNLQRFYNIIRSGLIDAHCKQSAASLQQQIALLMQVHEAWLEVERASGASPQVSPELDQAPPAISPPEPPLGGWSA